MSETLKKILVSSASLLMLAGISSGMSNFSSNANASVRKSRTTYHYSRRNKAHAFLEVHRNYVVPNTGNSDNADVGISAPTITKGYNNYLNGYNDIYSKPGYVTKSGRYYHHGVRITDHAGTYRLAKAREPFHAFRGLTDNNRIQSKHWDTDPTALEVVSKNKAWRGWISANGLYFYGGYDGKLPLHYIKAHKHVIRPHKIIKKHYKKNDNHVKHITSKKSYKRNKKTVKKHVIKRNKRFNKRNKYIVKSHKHTLRESHMNNKR